MENLNPKKEYYSPMHTAEHIFNQTMVRKFGIDRSFSNHIERKKSKCDFHFERNLSVEEIAQLEDDVNNIIGMNLEVTEELINISDARSQFDISRLPENSGDTIRVINVGNYDSCLCSGKHVSRTNEIGQFKIISTSHSENVLRVRFKLFNQNK